MQIDDRLATVLRFSADSAAMQRIQYRQLLDLLGTSPSEARSTQLDAGFVRLSELARNIEPQVRAVMLADPGLRLRSPRLVAQLAGAEPAVAAAAMRRAELTTEQWLDLIPALPVAARGFVRLRRGLGPAVEALLEQLGIHDRGLPPAEQAASDAVTIEAEPRTEGIGAIVRRIEAFRRSKEASEVAPAAGDSPRLPFREEHVLQVPFTVRAFDFATDADGRIVWADPGVAPMVVGYPLAAAALVLAEDFRRRQPLVAIGLELVGAPAIAGDWQLDATPWFDPVGGRFLGYRGRMRRLAELAPTAPPPESQSDRIRQMLHELRTPVNAIQGFAEVIQQQLFGPTPHEYRALAASIAGDAAHILAAFEELERLAKLDSGAMQLEEGEADLAEVVGLTVEQLSAYTRQRGSSFVLRTEVEAAPVPLARLELERVTWRLLATLAGASAPGEALRLRLRPRDGMIRLVAQMPAALAAREGESLFEANAGAIPQAISAGAFGVGFALRLARAEARAAGGALTRKDDKLRLDLPGLTLAQPGHSDRASAPR